ncbi:vitamin B12 ABC transporter permease BtuC [Vibrio marisflavi]|uniref:Vitamin B12 import system permease protein BtuC n=1 Tax=Vibrio marisflavi CECT 7928 TaxID=634439 RepID=A0ABM9A4B3_9VIBR|nr:vitamin B12 ABC transporter permease BtuC [Vibrio marisflavi]CAH0539689.1 Vitamin B12 import system permease protein BtuC [Vibrio marisflavi CECT 7928]
MEISQLLSQRTRQWRRAICILMALLIVASIAYLSFGQIFISPFGHFNELSKTLLVELRLPRLVAAILIGASLAVSGAVLQVLLGNVLAEPGVLGISGGSSLMMVILLFLLPFWATPTGMMIAAISGALAFTSILVFMAKRMRLTTARLLLVGVALGILTSAAITWAFYFSDNMNLRQLLYWLMGSVSGMSWGQLSLGVVILPFVVWLCSQGNTLDTLMLGETHAKQLGVNVHTIRWKLILAISVIVGCAVALGGVIGFVGLVVPHLVRLSIGTENKYLLPCSAISGALLVVLADLIARTSISGGELPLGVVTTTIGAPIFIWMLIRNYDSN